MNLLQYVRTLEERNSFLGRENQELRAENERLNFLANEMRQTINELLERISKLEKNSSTSSKPPSSDIVKPPQERRQKGKRRQGAQKHHKPHRMQLLSQERVSEFKNLTMESCPQCGHDVLEVKDAKKKVFQTIELVENPLIVTQYEYGKYYCKHCNKFHSPELPKVIKEQDVYGERLKSYIALLKSKGLSFSDIQQLLKEKYNLKISTGTLCKIIKKVSEALAFSYKELESNVRNESLLYIDETGWKDKGERLWAWVFCNNEIAYFKVGCKRTKSILESTLGEKFQGSIVSDFYGAYKNLESSNKQFCIAHLIRDIKFLTTVPEENVQKFGNELLKYFTKIFNVWHRREQMPIEKLKEKLKTIRDEISIFLSRDKHGKESKHIWRMKKRLLSTWEHLFTFMEDPERFEPTNNFAERTIRFVTKIRYLTQGTRSQWGRLWWSRMMSVMCTCRNKNISTYKFIEESIRAKNLGITPPSLLTYKGV